MTDFARNLLAGIGLVSRRMLGDWSDDDRDCIWAEAARWGLAVLGAICLVKILMRTF